MNVLNAIISLIIKRWYIFVAIILILVIGLGCLIHFNNIPKFTPSVSAEQVKNDFENSGYINEHPRILINKKGISTLKENIKKDALMKKWYDDCYKRAREYTDNEVITEYIYKPGVDKNKNIDLREANFSEMKPFARKIETLMPLLGLMYQLTGEKRFAETAWKYIEGVGNFPDWKNWHYLETAQNAYGFSIAYDMFYDYFSSKQKRFIERTLKNRAFVTSKYELENGEGWSKFDNNWNSCCFCGMVTTALAMYEVYPTDSIRVIRYAADYADLPFDAMAPDGVYLEGSTYWAFGMNYAVNMLAGLNNVLGKDYGLSDNKYLQVTGDYGIYSKFPNNSSFTYGDGWQYCQSGPFMYWLANRYDKPYYSWFVNSYGDEISCNDLYQIFNLYYYNPENVKEPDWDKMVLDKKFGGKQPFVTMRSKFHDPNALFVAFKGGVFPIKHQDLDAGDFIVSALGEQWTMDLGSGDYNTLGYWRYDKESARWKVYPKDAEAHNVIVFNPSEEAGQNPNGSAEFESFYTGKNAYAILDNTTIYEDDVKKSKRGIALINNRTQILVQDEFECINPSKVHWGLSLGEGEFTISEDGKTAYLVKNGKTMIVTLLNEGDCKFELRNLEPLPTSNKPEQKVKFKGKRLFVNFDNVTKETVKVLFTPKYNDDTKVEINDYGQLSDWAKNIK